MKQMIWGCTQVLLFAGLFFTVLGATVLQQNYEFSRCVVLITCVMGMIGTYFRDVRPHLKEDEKNRQAGDKPEDV